LKNSKTEGTAFMPMTVRKFSLPQIFFGRESLKYAGKCARILGAEKVFLVSDPGLEKAGWVEKVFEILESEKAEAPWMRQKALPWWRATAEPFMIMKAQTVFSAPSRRWSSFLPQREAGPIFPSLLLSRMCGAVSKCPLSAAPLCQTFPSLIR
jgi:hypothetical protein